MKVRHLSLKNWDHLRIFHMVIMSGSIRVCNVIMGSPSLDTGQAACVHCRLPTVMRRALPKEWKIKMVFKASQALEKVVKAP